VGGGLMRVLAVTVSMFGGDWPPVVAVAMGLHQRGHEVSVLGDAVVLEAIKGSGLAGIEWPEDLLPQRFFQDAGPDGDFDEILDAWAHGVEDHGAAVAHQTQADVLIGQLIGVVATNAVARMANVPWVFVNPAYYVGPDPARPIAIDQPRMADSFERTLLPAAAHAELWLHATDPVFDIIPADLPAHHHYVGPLLWTRPAPTPDFVTEDGPPWALVSLSTMPMAHEADLANAAIAALLEHDVRILLTGTAAHSMLTVETARQAVHVEPFVPHDAVLERAAIFVSHGGHGGVMRAMSHGVPMTLVPWGRDQDGVGYRAERLGVAKVVQRDALSMDSLAEAVNAALTDPDIAAESRKTAARLASMSPATQSARLIEAAFG
jgi:UDP:flavonoid glycosyltransferase YjiC (YdhE family)